MEFTGNTHVGKFLNTKQVRGEMGIVAKSDHRNVHQELLKKVFKKKPTGTDDGSLIGSTVHLEAAVGYFRLFYSIYFDT